MSITSTFMPDPRAAAPHVAANHSDLCGVGSTHLFQNGALRGDHCHEIIPRLGERSGAFLLKLAPQSVHVDSGFAERSNGCFAITPIGGKHATRFSVVAKR